MRKSIISFVTVMVLTSSMPLNSFAHSGRTDSSGGHKDNKNKSGLGSYHYHCGGNPAHLHNNGICPYSSNKSASENSNAEWIGDMYWNGSSFAKGWTKINGKTYYFDNYCSKVTGWISDSDDNTFYLGSDGVLRTEWQKIGKSKYYFGTNGIMRIGWRKIKGHTYYFGNDGIMRTGFRKINDKVYYFDEYGIMETGWTEIGENTYYFKTNGVMLIGKYRIGDNVYEFDSSGKLVK